MDAKLVMFRSGGEKRDFRLSGPKTLVGRKNDCDIRIPVNEVSRHHAEFHIDGDAVTLKDLNSANGTFVNNKRVKTVTLSAGDHVIIGPVVFTVQINGKPEEIRPVKTRLKKHPAAAIDDSEPAMVQPQSQPVPDEELDPISALEALASSADQTAIDPFEEEEL